MYDIDTAYAAAAGIATAAAAALIWIKSKATPIIYTAIRNTDADEMAAIIDMVREAKGKQGPQGADVTNEELQEIGLAVWNAVKD